MKKEIMLKVIVFLLRWRYSQAEYRIERPFKEDISSLKAQIINWSDIGTSMGQENNWKSCWIESRLQENEKVS